MSNIYWAFSVCSCTVPIAAYLLFFTTYKSSLQISYCDPILQLKKILFYDSSYWDMNMVAHYKLSFCNRLHTTSLSSWSNWTRFTPPSLHCLFYAQKCFNSSTVGVLRALLWWNIVRNIMCLILVILIQFLTHRKVARIVWEAHV